MNPVIQPQRRSWKMRQSDRKLLLFIGDFLVAMLALAASILIWSQSPEEWLNLSPAFLRERVPVWFYLLPVIWLLLLVEMYDTQRANNRQNTFKGISIAAAISAVLYLIVYFSSAPDSLPRRGVAGFIIGVYVLTLLWRFLYISIFTQPQFMRRVLIVGAGKAGTTLVDVVKNLWPPPFYLVGLIDDDPQKIDLEIEGYRVMGASRDLMQVIQDEGVTDLVCAISGEMAPDTVNTLLQAEEAGIEITTMPIMYETLLGRVPINLLQSDWVLRSFVDQAHLSGTFEIAKRLIDIVGALVGLLFLVLLFPFIGVMILLDSGGPVLYLQERLGKNGRVHKIIKFRTMKLDAEKDGVARPATQNDQRATRFGKLLRRSHLDELPQIINILKGEMSWVGPRSERPEIIQNLEKEIPFYRARLFVKPGLTGWAQVNYGYAAGAEENSVKLEYDLYYIKHRNLGLDILILLRTVGNVLGLKGR